MQKTPLKAEFPTMTLSLSVVCTISSLAIVTGLLFQAKNAYREVILQSIRIERLKGEIMRLDEVLTMSARMAAATGELSWEERYKANEQPLDQAIKEVLSVLPPEAANSSAKATDEANAKLVDMETRAFEAVRSGDKTAANNLLFGADYENQKKIYAAGMSALTARLNQQVYGSLSELEDRSNFAILVSLGLMPLVGFFWYYNLRNVGRWRAFVLEVNKSLDDEIDRRTEQLQTEQVRSLSAAKMATLGEMAGGIAHEINNPLGIIHGFADYLGDICKDEAINAAQVRMVSDKIRTATDRISKIVQGLRRFSRDGSRDPLEMASISTILDETLSLCQQKIHSHEITVTTKFTDKDLLVPCRPVEISQVLLNLLNNAVDALEESTRKEIVIEVRVQKNQDEVHILVRNSGPQIPAALREKIMQPFFSTKPVGKGTGLGLSIAKTIMAGHRGRLEIDASQEETCFVMALPLKMLTSLQQVA